MLLDGINTNKPFYLRKAMRFDVYKSTDPILKKNFKKIWEEVYLVYSENTQRIRDKQKRRSACNAILLNLWKAYYLSFNPWVSYTRNKNHYAKGTRLNKLHFKYESFIQTFNTLEEIGYITNKPHVNYPGYRFTSRMKASRKLISFFEKNTPITNRVSLIENKRNEDLIVLKDKDKKPISYRSNPTIKKWHAHLIIINNRLSKTRIALEMKDDLYQALIERLNQEIDKEDYLPDFTNTSLYRVFNNGTFEQGGRFYGGWWQSIPREYRKYITINHKPTEEVDYSGHHLRILYALEKKELIGQPYEVSDNSRNTKELIQDRKNATLIMLNCKSPTKAFYTIKSDGIKQSKVIMEEIMQRHEPIKDQFFKGVGNKLMNEDSKIAEEVMLEMLKLNHLALPVHDSFIVRNTATVELKAIMKRVFTEQYRNNKTILKTKETIFDLPNRDKHLNNENGSINMDLELLVKDTTRVRTLWGF